jgi:hypothetical protein
MTAIPDVIAPSAVIGVAPDHRRSPVPTFAMISSKFKELRKRRGLMAALISVVIGIPVLFLGIRLLLHAISPKSYGPAGGYEIYVALVSGVLYSFGFIMAAALGAAAGSSDLTEGVFRHLVVTGRSRIALYLARIPAGLAIIVPLVAAGFTVVCAVCVFAAPTRFSYDNVNVPAGLSEAGLESWAGAHADQVICGFGFQIGPNSEITNAVNAVPCANNGPGPSGAIVKAPPGASPPSTAVHVSQAEIRQAARRIAAGDYADYARQFLFPTTSLMIKSGLWLELEAIIGFLVALGLSSLIGQRTVTVILLIILEIVLTPIMSKARIPHLVNLQRAVVGLATAHLTPGGLPVLGGGGGGGGANPGLLPESTVVAVIVIAAWLVGWSALGAWRMATRDT